MRRPLKKLVTLVYLAAATLVFLEVGVRLWGYSEPHIFDPIYMPFERTMDIPYVHKPNLVNARARGLAVINTDTLGLRSKASGAIYGSKKPNEYRIAIVGDSVTFGEGVPRTEDTYCQILEDLLNQQHKALTVRVFNYGATAYSVKQMAATLPYRMLEIEPDLVLMAIIPDDLNLGRAPGIVSAGYVVDEKLSGILSPDSMARHMLRRVHLAYALRDIGFSLFNARDDMGERIAAGQLPESYSYIRKFKEIAERHRLPYSIVLLPRMRSGAWGRIPSQLTGDGIAHVDLSSLADEFTTVQYYASRFDRHASPAVHRRIGQVLARHILEHEMKLARVPG
jgi:hypothetical protein